jgi:hypothetical protein
MVLAKVSECIEKLGYANIPQPDQERLKKELVSIENFLHNNEYAKEKVRFFGRDHLDELLQELQEACGTPASSVSLNTLYDCTSSIASILH